MNKITQVFHRLNGEGKKAFIPYLTGGDPTGELSFRFMELLAKKGADIIELGIPFSDPMADGPVIQRAMNRALKGGTNLKEVLSLVEHFKSCHEVPVILMGYLNSIYAYGVEAFGIDAKNAGVDGVLMVDMPPEEAQDFCEILSRHRMAGIFLATPVSDDKRIRIIKKFAKGFLYFVSVTGVTGEREILSPSLCEKISSIRRRVKLPVALGFGISGPAIIREFFPYLDGFVVGSALIRRWEASSFNVHDSELNAFLTDLVKACHGL